ncbi:hypothetical protein AAHD62_22155 [Enterobacter hormaechei]
MSITLNALLILVDLIFIILYLVYLIKIKAFSMNAEPLTHQPLFRAVIIIPIVSFFLIGGVAWSGHSIQLDENGLNNFLNISKLPLAVLSLTLPFGVIVNNVHRTIQTDRQIKEAERKNNLDRYYAHRKNTIEIIDNFELSTIFVVNDEIQLEFENSYSTYKKFYPQASVNSSNYNSSELFIYGITELFRQLNSLLNITEFDTRVSYFKHLTSIEENLYQIHRLFGFKPVKVDKTFGYVFIDSDNITYEFRTYIRNEHCLKMNIATYWLAYLSISEFLEAYVLEDVKKELHGMFMYGINTQVKYAFWAPQNLVKARIPQVIRIAAA